MAMQSFNVNANDAGRRLDKYLFKLLDIPGGLIYKYLRTGHIKVNKKKQPGSYMLAENDVVTLFIPDDCLKQRSTPEISTDLLPDIVYETEDLLIVNKPQGLKSQPDHDGDTALSEIVKSYLIKSGAYRPDEERSFAPALCNRLDRNTEGLVIAAKTAEALRLLNEKIKVKEVRKFYQCIVSGAPPKKRDTLKGYIIKDREKNLSRIVTVPSDGALAVETAYRVVQSVAGRSLLEIELKTGRSHQIRAHMASIGCPILGDCKYGGGRGKQKLCAYKLIFDFKTDAGALSYLQGKTVEIAPSFINEVTK